MNKFKQWAQYFDEHKHPCFINKKSTGEILYCNENFLTLYSVDGEAVGKTFHEVVSICSIQAVKEYPNWDLQEVFETETYNKDLNKRFLVKSSLIYDSDTIFNQIIPLDEGVDSNSVFEEAMTRCLELFQSQDGSNRMIDGFTELLGQFYDAQVAYIYRFQKHNGSIEPLSTWVSEDFVPTEGDAPKMPKERVLDWFQDPNTPTIILGDENHSKNLPMLSEIMSTFGVNNVVFSKVDDGTGEVVGFVGVSNRRNTKEFVDLRFLSTIARFVSQDVAKEYIDATLFQLHYHDMLTGMYNRVGYGQKTDKILKNPPKTMGVIFVNVNGLKIVNENAGIQEGDKHIKNATNQLKTHFDYEFFRLSGDEFVGIAENVDKEVFEQKVISLHEAMKKEENYDFSMGHSWGTGSYDFNRLVQEAEIMMYINKQEYYSSQKRSFDSVGDNTLSDLLSFLEHDEFMVYLQPQVRLKDGSLHGAEALIRRFDKTNQKMVFPDQFIPLYEQKSVIRHVDMFVVESVCKLIAQWLLEGKHIPISVNLSRVTLQEFGVVDTIVEICDRYSIPHNLLVIEVTERVGLIENNVASSLIQDFKKHGFSISLDDFGCAYSNIVTLAQIDVDEVKIDKSLVDELLSNHKNSVIVESVLSMCNKLENTTTLAEGIEEEAQAEVLKNMTCGLGQGYFYSRPIPIDEFQNKYMQEITEQGGATE